MLGRGVGNDGEVVRVKVGEFSGLGSVMGDQGNWWEGEGSWEGERVEVLVLLLLNTRKWPKIRAKKLCYSLEQRKL